MRAAAREAEAARSSATAGGAAPEGTASPTCQRCGFPVLSRSFGCKNPCSNCGTVYPLGDCSD